MDVCRELVREGVNTFYLGGYGGFDMMAAQAVKALKQETKDISSVLVLPYLNGEVNTSLYDATIYPPLEFVPPRFAISRRNEWMIEQSDIVIAYVMHSWGGAAKTLQFARRKQKRVILYNN